MINNFALIFALQVTHQKQEGDSKQSMDKRSAISQSNKSRSLSLESVDAIETVARKLRDIGDNLNQSYKKQRGRVVRAPDLKCGGPGFKSRSDH